VKGEREESDRRSIQGGITGTGLLRTCHQVRRRNLELNHTTAALTSSTTRRCLSRLRLRTNEWRIWEPSRHERVRHHNASRPSAFAWSQAPTDTSFYDVCYICTGLQELGFVKLFFCLFLGWGGIGEG
jgi:hypothetical protein